MSVMSMDKISSDDDEYFQHLRKVYLQDTLSTSGKQGETYENDAIPLSQSNGIVSCTPSSSLTESEKIHYNRAMRELKDMMKISKESSKQDDNYLSHLLSNDIKEVYQSDELSSDENVCAVKDQPEIEDNETTLTQSATLPTISSGFTTGTEPPSSPIKQRKSVRISLEPTTFINSEVSSGMEGTWPGPGILRTSSVKQMEAVDVKVIHAELINIHSKLNERSESLVELEEELEMREQDLLRREESIAEQEELLATNMERLRRNQDVMIRLQGVEAEVEEKLDLLQENHLQAVDELTSGLNEKIKENKRIRCSFDAIKSQNDHLKQQVGDYSEQNHRLQIQNSKLKKRLENLQRKLEYTSQKKNNSQVLTDQQFKEPKKLKVEEQSQLSKTIDKSTKACSASIETLSTVLDWICDVYLRPSGVFDQQLEHHHFDKNYVTDQCLKILPQLVDQIRYMSLCTSNSKVHLPYLRFVHWSLYHLEDTHHAILTSTARRIGEELVKPSSYKGLMDQSIVSAPKGNSTVPNHEGNKCKPQIFFKSPNAEVRLLSALIVLRTLHQVDMLAQIFDHLKSDLKETSNRKCFLEYAAVQVVLPYLSYKSNKALLGSAVDVMLQMSVESDILPAFLESCSCEKWFKTIASAIRSIIQSSDTVALEKLCVILQKLSKIKGNRRFFESFSIGRLLQEKFRDCDPESTFLSLNLRSILFNLGLLKN